MVWPIIVVVRNAETLFITLKIRIQLTDYNISIELLLLQPNHRQYFTEKDFLIFKYVVSFYECMWFNSKHYSIGFAEIHAR